MFILKSFRKSEKALLYCSYGHDQNINIDPYTPLWILGEYCHLCLNFAIIYMQVHSVNNKISIDKYPEIPSNQHIRNTDLEYFHYSRKFY